ncbi:MAG: sodium:solute symporter [Gemmatimonadales bacterium]
MNLGALDWLIIAAFFVFVAGTAIVSRPLVRSVADFLAAGRTAGRYVLSVSQGAAAVGAITIVGTLEMNYIAGFQQAWWALTTAVVVIVIAVTGWVAYRFRETRCLTMAEFFERRYSRRFRIFAGSIAYLSGIVNFGIFPAVEARFFIYFVGLPHRFALLGVDVAAFPVMVAFLLVLSLVLVFVGGQVAVILTDFLQGLFINALFLVMSAYLLVRVRWSQVVAGLLTAPHGASLVDPYHASQVADFNFWYFLIGVIGVVYTWMSWQGTQGYNASAKSAHEARMAWVLYAWRMIPQTLVLLVIAVVAYAVLHNADFAGEAARANAVIRGAGAPMIQSQLRVPVVLSQLLPPGLMGAFTAVMLATALTCKSAYMHSWGSIFVQDVFIPLRGKPLEPREHLRVLRWSILFVAAFTFAFSILFQQSQAIFLFFAITGAIFAGGSGAVIIGGLYWKRGTTAAAYTAMILGAGISVGGIVLLQLDPKFPVNGQWFWGIAMAAASVGYVMVSLVGKRGAADLGRLLHRGVHALSQDQVAVTDLPPVGWRALGLDREASRGDRATVLATYGWISLWAVAFVIGTVLSAAGTVSEAAWASFWHAFLLINLVAGVVVLFWFGTFGIRDLGRMLRALRGRERDATDDGFVRRVVP